MAAVPKYPLKRGDSLFLACTAALPGSSGWTATCDMKKVNAQGQLELVFTLDVALTPPVDPDTLWAVTLKKDGSAFVDLALVDYRFDIRFARTGWTGRTNTGIITLLQEITGEPA